MKRLNDKGLTLTELIITIVFTGMVVGMIMTFVIGYLRYSYLLESDLDTYVTRLNAGDAIRELIGSSTGLIIQNSITDTNSNSPDPADPTNSFWVPIHAVPTTITMPAAGSAVPLVYFKRLSFNSSNQIIMNGAQPYEDEYVLYLDGTSKQLLLRSLANTFAPGNRLITSCPPSAATASCPADKIIAQNVSSINTRYFSRTGNTVDWMSVYDPLIGQYIGPDFPYVDVVEFTVNLTKKPLFQKTNATQNSTVIRVALRNA